MNMSTDPKLYLFAAALIASMGATISTLEWICSWRQLKDDGLFSWRVIGARKLTVGPGLLAALLDRLLSFRPFVCILALRALFLLYLPYALWFERAPTLVLLGIVISSLLLHLRSPWGMDGSDQMLTQVFGALFLSYLAGSPLAYKAGLFFIAGQSCLSYLTAGVAKAVSKDWQGGKVVFGIFNTRTYGYEPMARILLNQEALNKALTWGAFTMECSFPLVLFAGFPGCLVFVAWGVSFHLMNAVVMGLNSFFWAFMATYPAVIYCSIVIGGHLYK
jgi:hypothetical protein